MRKEKPLWFAVGLVGLLNVLYVIGIIILMIAPAPELGPVLVLVGAVNVIIIFLLLLSSR
jgi:hypothetical protein